MATFDTAVDEILTESLDITKQRGDEYGDTWADDNLMTTFTQRTLRDFGMWDPTPEQCRLILLAALIDVKDSRMLGGYKEDSLVDGINYRAVYAAMRRKYDANKDQHLD